VAASLFPHELTDLTRDAVSGFVGGLLLLGVSWFAATRRARRRATARVEERLDDHAVEIRHTQRESNVEPFYPGKEL